MPQYWVAVKELKLNYDSSETILFTIYPDMCIMVSEIP